MDQGPKGPPRAEAEGQPSIKALPLKQCRRASPSTRARERNGGLRRSPPKGLQKGGHGGDETLQPSAARSDRRKGWTGRNPIQEGLVPGTRCGPLHPGPSYPIGGNNATQAGGGTISGHMDLRGPQAFVKGGQIREVGVQNQQGEAPVVIQTSCLREGSSPVEGEALAKLRCNGILQDHNV